MEEEFLAFHSLEAKQQYFLAKDESLWRLKSRAVWIFEGDTNTIFFHHYANYIKSLNSIWALTNPKGFRLLLHSNNADEGLFYSALCSKIL